MKASRYLPLVTFAALFAGCATTAPNELVKARSAYQFASEGPAQQLAPAELHKAHEALNQAEQSFEKDSDSFKTKDLSYIAERKAMQAGALGSIAAAKASKDSSNDNFTKKQAEIVKQGKQDLSDAERRNADAQTEIIRQAEIKAAQQKSDAENQMQQAQLAQGRKDLRASEKRTSDAHAELDKQAGIKAAEEKAAADFKRQQALIAQEKKDQLDAEKSAIAKQTELDKQAALKAANDKAEADILKAKLALSESENRNAAALATLATLASLKEEERGVVVTLTGSVLFKSGKSTLMPSAQTKLDQVANALLTIQARNLIIEGHTDSQGSDADNQELSQRRSEAVRDYLVQRGYPASHIQSQGRGEGSPVAKNDSPEGRANNRRVEIVIARESR